MAKYWLRRLALAALCALNSPSAAALDCAPLQPATPIDVATIPHGHGLLWRIHGPGDRVSYLFGTMHVADARVLDVLTHVQAEFTTSRQFVLEVVIDPAGVRTLQQAMFYHDGRQLADRAGPDLATAAAAHLAAYGMPAELSAVIKPWAAFTTLSMPRDSHGLPLDLQLLARAEQAGKRVQGLESMDEQLAIFETMANDLQIELLREAVCNYALFQGELEQMVSAYSAGDLAALLVSAQRYATDHQAALLEVLLWTRNQRMAARLVPLLADGNAFIAVGALHLPGARGLLALLEQQGYRVEAVY